MSLFNGLPDRCVDLIYIDPPLNANRQLAGDLAGSRGSLPSEVHGLTVIRR
jgi:hypothetical protein